MPDLSSNFAGIKSPNPFWLSSGPPTNTAYQVRNAFDTGWGGAVWKTLSDDPIVNVASRYGGIALNNQKLMGLNNIELISDRSLADNLEEIAEVKKKHPANAIIASVMVESKRESWHNVIKRIQDVGVDGFELNFGCPHGMNERGMGSAVGQVPEYAEMICSWVKEVATVPVLAKLTPNVTDIKAIARAVKRGGADGISLINTINSVIGIDLNSFSPKPSVGGLGSHGGYCGPAVKPIALYMVSEIARDPEVRLPISGIGGIRKWEDCAEFMLLGASNVQVCTAVMHRGFGIVKAMTRGLENWMKQKGFETIGEFVGQATPRIRPWGELDLNYRVVAKINESTCIHCGICYACCEDGCYQAIDWEKMPHDKYAAKFGEPRNMKGEAAPNLRLEDSDATVDVFTVNVDGCVGCNMCALACPVENCITMEEVPTGKEPMNWNQYQALLKNKRIEPIQPKKAVKTIATAGEKVMPRIVRAGLIQATLCEPATSPTAKIKKAMIDKHIAMTAEAASKGAQILCFQELFYGPYFCAEQKTRWYELVEKIPDGPTTKLFCEIAKKNQTVIVLPIYEEDLTGVYYNTTAVIDADGSYLGKFRKIHIPHCDPGFWEKFYFRPGNLGYPVFETKAGKIGVYTCYDRHFPEGWRALGLAGAEIVFNPSATVAGLSEYLWKLEQPAAAANNIYFVGAINRPGFEEPWRIGEFYGSSYFADPRGQIIAQGSRSTDSIVIADLNLDLIREVRNTWQFYRDRRPETYNSLIAP